MDHFFHADNGDGTFTNPVLYTDYSDPDAIRVGDEYFMVASSFCNAPGLPLLCSRDLISWEPIGYVKVIKRFMQRDGTRRTAGINPNKYQQSIEGTAFENA